MGPIPHLDVWRSATRARGGQCVMIAGTALMLELSAISLGSPVTVR